MVSWKYEVSKDKETPLSHLIHGGTSYLELTSKLPVDFRTPARYAEDKHKDDKAVPTKKWKFL